MDEASRAVFAGVGLVSGAVWTDLDGDGLPELVLATEWGPLRVFRNRGGRFEAWDAPLVWAGSGPGRGRRPGRLGALTGWWNGVNAGDFDGDGRLDLVAANWGLNCRQREFLADGWRVFHGDVDGNGTWDVLEAFLDPGSGKLVPWRDFPALKAALRPVGTRFASYAAFAQAGVADLLAEAAEPPSELRVDHLESTLFLNRGDHFEAHPLPWAAQLAPAFAVCVGDYDGDGHEDVFLGQNFFGTDLETGRLDAGRGLWLRGDGTGRLVAVPGQESGVIVYGEQRGAALADYDADGRVDLAVTQNAARTRLFRNVRGRPGLRLRLAGPGGNGSGIGAVVRLGNGETWGPAREIHAGSGYWSQDSAVQILAPPRSPAARIQVRWPGGRVTTASIPAGARTLGIGADGTVEVLP
jgi:hypothetical protein